MPVTPSRPKIVMRSLRSSETAPEGTAALEGFAEGPRTQRKRTGTSGRFTEAQAC